MKRTICPAAIISLGFSIFAMFVIPFGIISPFLGLAGTTAGILALIRINNRKHFRGRGVAMAGIIIGCIAVVTSLAYMNLHQVILS